MLLKPYVKKFLEGSPLANLTTVEDLINYRGMSLEFLPTEEDRPKVQAIENRTVLGPDGHFLYLFFFMEEDLLSEM